MALHLLQKCRNAWTVEFCLLNNIFSPQKWWQRLQESPCKSRGRIQVAEQVDGSHFLSFLSSHILFSILHHPIVDHPHVSFNICCDSTSICFWTFSNEKTNFHTVQLMTAKKMIFIHYHWFDFWYLRLRCEEYSSGECSSRRWPNSKWNLYIFQNVKQTLLWIPVILWLKISFRQVEPNTGSKNLNVFRLLQSQILSHCSQPVSTRQKLSWWRRMGTCQK